jgi:UDP:flavonoid glycosyltransferase YjiC (YdhE family)
LIPKPEDWGARISVSGFYFLPPSSDYTPPLSLQSFLDLGSPPVYIGFGSIVIDDPQSLTLLLLEAVRLAGVRAIISAGWSGLGDLDLPPEIHLLAECPHDWIFARVSCVVHHGGAGTTAAAIAAGKPSVVVPFFGDQPFWGHMIARAGAGPEPIPFKSLTAIGLAAAIESALGRYMQEKSHALGGLVNKEKGIECGIRSFYQQLNLAMLQCSLTPMSAATWRIRKTDIRLGSTSSALLIDMGLLDLDKLEL